MVSYEFNFLKLTTNNFKQGKNMRKALKDSQKRPNFGLGNWQLDFQIWIYHLYKKFGDANFLSMSRPPQNSKQIILLHRILMSNNKGLTYLQMYRSPQQSAIAKDLVYYMNPHMLRQILYQLQKLYFEQPIFIECVDFCERYWTIMLAKISNFLSYRMFREFSGKLLIISSLTGLTNWKIGNYLQSLELCEMKYKVDHQWGFSCLKKQVFSDGISTLWKIVKLDGIALISVGIWILLGISSRILATAVYYCYKSNKCYRSLCQSEKKLIETFKN